MRFIEISRTAGRELGVQWSRFGESTITNIGNRVSPNNLSLTAATIAGEAAAGVFSDASPFGFLVGRIVSGGATTDVMINALEQKGIARSLAEPNLVALSGDTASFLAGGEYPLPVAGSFGSVTVDYKKYGVGLAFTPTVLGQGLVNMRIEPEVSQIDTTHTVTVSNGISVPALIVRRASTTVELRDGQSFAIAGLLSDRVRSQIEKVPFYDTAGSVKMLAEENLTDAGAIASAVASEGTCRCWPGNSKLFARWTFQKSVSRWPSVTVRLSTT